MGLVEILILAVVQGMTEFLPVSSSGHLVVAAALLGKQELGGVLVVNVALHVGTLLSVLVYYWRRVWRLLGRDRRVLPLLVVGTLPAVVVGLALKKFAPQLLESPLLAGLMFPITAIMLIWGSRRPPGDEDYTQIGYRQALLVGCFQALGILPGISRSGATIVAGLAANMRRDSAATFAFLLAIPAIAGAAVLELIDVVQAPESTTPFVYLVAGALVAFLVGLAALAGLVHLVRHGRLIYFAYWLIPLGIAVTIWQLAIL